MPIMDQLQAATHAQHTQLEALPFVEALTLGKLPLASYVNFLQAYLIIFTALEQVLSDAADPTLTAVWRDQMRKSPLLERDLLFFAPRIVPSLSDALLHAELMAQTIRGHARRNPAALLGYLYVLEGASLGGLLLRSLVMRQFQLLPPQGVGYLSGYGKQSKAQWQQFGARMNQAVSDRLIEQVLAAGREAFGLIGKVLATLYPPTRPDSQALLAVLNPHAGQHALPQNLPEVEAALRAGEISWQQFPYYEQRYGARGAAFTRSDSVWLVTLSAYMQAIVDQQISWLGRLLAARGMPQFMLEQHLLVLYNELVAAVPDQPRYATLRQAALRLATLRREQMSDEQFTGLVAAFEAQVASIPTVNLPRAGELIVAAVADERQGIQQAVPSLLSWLADPNRFPPAWLSAVAATLEQARQFESVQPPHPRPQS